jgi:serine/threonine protein kinase
MDHRWERITELLNAALDRMPEERPGFLERECRGDAELRGEVESLLASHRDAGDFLDRPAAVAGGFVPAPDEGDALAGQALGPYRVVRRIGRGGMGLVYLAEDTRLGRSVAIKILPKAFAADKGREERLRLEARAAAALSHPGIATVFSIEELDGRLCLVTEYVRGDTLRAELEHGPLSLDLLIETGIQIARGLAAAHAAGVVHRDLKPDNIIRSAQGQVKILDFGIAHVDAPMPEEATRLTGLGQAIGTPGYMSPEQIDGADVDPRSDIFALGVLLFELATGVHPFTGATPAASAGKAYAGTLPPLTSVDARLPAQLDAIVRKCAQRNRGERYTSALDVARDLQDLRDGRQTAVAAEPGPARLSSPRWWWQIHQVAAMLVEAALVYAVWRAHKVQHTDFTLAVLLAYITTVAINGTLRAHLVFTSAFIAAETRVQLRRATPAVRATDLAAAALLLTAAAASLRADSLLSATLAAFGVGWAVVSLVVEPATRDAAFRDRPGAVDRP